MLATWCEELTHRKDPDAGKDRRQEENWTTESEMVGWHHQLNTHEFEQALAHGEEQGSLACWTTWGCKESDMIEWQNNKSNIRCIFIYKANTETSVQQNSMSKWNTIQW